MSVEENHKTSSEEWQEKIRWVAGGLYILPNPAHNAGPSSEWFLKVRGRLYHHYGVLSAPESHSSHTLKESCWAIIALSKALSSKWPEPAVQRIFSQIVSATYFLKSQLGETK